MAATRPQRAALVTGGTGFVGSALCRLLVEQGWSVTATSRHGMHYAGVAGLRYAQLPLNENPEGWIASMRGADCVVHLAAHVHVLRAGMDDFNLYRRVNVDGSRFVAEMAERAGVRRLVFLSSIKVNGERTLDRPFQATDPACPEDDYGRSKHEAELVLQLRCARAGIDLVILRPPLVYGPGVRANFRRLMTLAAAGLPLPLASIRAKRSLIGLGNLADLLAVCMCSDLAAGAVWLASDGEDLSTPELFRRVARQLGRPSRLFAFPPSLLRQVASLVGRAQEVNRLCESLQVDSTPVRVRLGWQPPFTVDEGLALTAGAFVKS